MEPIRVLHVVAIMNRGGLESMIMNHYRQIDRTKIQFDFLVHRTEKGIFDDEIRDLGGDIYYLPRFNPLKNNTYNKALDEFFEKMNYKIVHAHYNALSMWSLRSAEKKGVPVRIAHSHLAYPNFNYQTPIWWYGMSKINDYCNYRFGASKDALDWLFGKQHSKQGIVFKNAIKLKEYIFDKDTRTRMRKELNVEGKIVIGHVGRFHPSKNHQFIVKVFKKLVDHDSSYHLVLVGDGPEKEKIQELVNELNISKNASFLGVREDVSDILQAMDLFIFPSLFEALPVTLIEAQASGLPVFTSDNITKEVSISNLVKYLPLEQYVDDWVTEIFNHGKNLKRNNMSEIIKTSGYDVEANAKWLENFYITKYEENK